MAKGILFFYQMRKGLLRDGLRLNFASGLGQASLCIGQS